MGLEGGGVGPAHAMEQGLAAALLVRTGLSCAGREGRGQGPSPLAARRQRQVPGRGGRSACWAWGAAAHLGGGGGLLQHALLLRQLPPERCGLRRARAVPPQRLCRRLLRLPQPLLRAGQLLLGHGQVSLPARQLSLQVGHLRRSKQQGQQGGKACEEVLHAWRAATVLKGDGSG